MRFKVLNKIKIFDFDDTLVYTDAKINIPNKNLKFSTRQFAKYYHDHPDEDYDYSEFRQGELKNPRPTAFFRTAFKHIVDKNDSDIMILTARPNTEEVKKYLSKYINIDKVIIVGAAKTPELKKKEIGKLLDRYEDIRFFDDSIANIEAVESLNNPKITTQIVKR